MAEYQHCDSRRRQERQRPAFNGASILSMFYRPIGISNFASLFLETKGRDRDIKSPAIDFLDPGCLDFGLRRNHTE